MICETDGCIRAAVWRVGLDDRRKDVCRDCRDELIALHGWVLKRSLYKLVIA